MFSIAIRQISNNILRSFTTDIYFPLFPSYIQICWYLVTRCPLLAYSIVRWAGNRARPAI